jgi:putative DNA primase/helicase
MIPMDESFLGREDFDLTEKLLEERAGILNWAIDGWRRLRDRGKFIQPVSGMALVQKLSASTSTIGSFILDCCVLGPEEKVSCEMLWSAFCEWSDRRGLAVTLGTNPSYSPKLPKRATDVAESRNSIHVSGCETDSRID